MTQLDTEDLLRLCVALLAATQPNPDIKMAARYVQKVLDKQEDRQLVYAAMMKAGQMLADNETVAKIKQT